MSKKREVRRNPEQPVRCFRKSAIGSACAAMVGLAPMTMAMAQDAQPVPPAAADQAQLPVVTQATAPSGSSGGASTQLQGVTVTGTLVRGIAPVGSNPIVVSKEDMQLTGATNTNQVLATLPVITNAFNTTTISQTADPGTTTFRPNIRNFGAGGGNTTLVLMDGHDMVGAGVGQTTPDSGVIPPGMLERIEVLPDGGSSMYGADAVGGIVNFITKRKFNGVEFDGDYGFTADGYNSDSENITMGQSWHGGSAMVSWLHRSNTYLLARNREFPRLDLTSHGGSNFDVTTCNTPNVTVGSFEGLGGTTYQWNGSSYSPGAATCDNLLNSSIVPREEQDAMFATITQRLNDWAKFDLTAYYSRRQTETLSAPLIADSITIPNSNYYYTPVGTETSQQVSFSYDPAFGNPVSSGQLTDFGLTPTFTFDVGDDWQIKAMYNYGWSDTWLQEPEINPDAQAAAAAGTTAATALNPYNIAATNPDVLAALANYESYGDNKQTLSDSRVIGDGPLFHLPGGTVHLAVGAEYQYQTDSPLFNNPGPISLRSEQPRGENSRRVAAGFFELVIPVVGSANQLPLVKSLEFDLSARHDQYSDFGGTNNPRIAFNWRAVDGIAFRGNIGRSFNAPSLVDLGDPEEFQLLSNSVFAFLPGGAGLAGYVRPMIVLAGGNRKLQPQTALTYSTGVDFTPKWIEGLRFGITYWNVNLQNTISVIPPSLETDPFNPVYQGKYVITNPTQAQVQALGAANNVPNTAQIVQQTYGSNNPPYLYVDAHMQNGGNVDANGLDWYVNFARNVGWGAVFASVNATYSLTQTNIVDGLSSSLKVDNLTANTSPLQIAGTFGTKWKQLTSTVSITYSHGYDVTGATNQTHIGSFQPVNLAFIYSFKEADGLLQGMSLQLNVNNLFDDYPPFLNEAASAAFESGGGTGNGSTIGRFFEFGLRKVF